MTGDLSPGVAASNALTARWAARHAEPDRSFVMSGCSVWPLLAALARGAEGDARKELERAIGLSAADAASAIKDVLSATDRVVGAHGAIGIWVRAPVPLRAEWTSALPAGILGSLSGSPKRDQLNLDAWVKEHTFGIVERFPITIGMDSELLLAACLAIRTKWEQHFDSEDLASPFKSGPWKARPATCLSASFHDLGLVSVFDTAIGPLTTFKSEGKEPVDVHLILGAEGSAPGDVLAQGILALTGGAPARSGSDLGLGRTAPGLNVEEEQSRKASPPSLRVRTVGFEIAAALDLLEHRDLFGLTTAADPTHGHFPGISSFPLAVGQARQDTRATFSGKGFEAASVTVLEMMLGMARGGDDTHTVRTIHLEFDRPFGFVAIDRVSGLVYLAGWVAEPGPLQRADTVWGSPFDRVRRERTES